MLQWWKRKYRRPKYRVTNCQIVRLSDEEVDPQLRMSEEERIYGMIRGSALATQAVLWHTRVQINPTVERDPPW